MARPSPGTHARAAVPAFANARTLRSLLRRCVPLLRPPHALLVHALFAVPAARHARRYAGTQARSVTLPTLVQASHPRAGAVRCTATNLTAAFMAGDVSCRGAQYSAVYAARCRRNVCARCSSRASPPTGGVCRAAATSTGESVLAAVDAPPNATVALWYGPGAEQSTPNGAASTGSGTRAAVAASRWAAVAVAAHGRRLRDSCHDALRGRESMAACVAVW